MSACMNCDIMEQIKSTNFGSTPRPTPRFHWSMASGSTPGSISPCSMTLFWLRKWPLMWIHTNLGIHGTPQTLHILAEPIFLSRPLNIVQLPNLVSAKNHSSLSGLYTLLPEVVASFSWLVSWSAVVMLENRAKNETRRCTARLRSISPKILHLKIR